MELGLLIPRLVVGGLFVGHGAQKLFGVAAVAFAVTGIGAGDWSLDHALGLHVSGSDWAIGALGAGLAGGLATIASGRLAGTRESAPRSRPGTGAS